MLESLKKELLKSRADFAESFLKGRLGASEGRYHYGLGVIEGLDRAIALIDNALKVEHDSIFGKD